MNERWRLLIEQVLPYKGRLLGTLAGLIIGNMLIWLGLLRTLVVLLCVALGFYFGAGVDGVGQRRNWSAIRSPRYWRKG